MRTDIQNGDFTGCDIRVFNQYAFIWRNDFKVGNQTARSEENFFGPPAKLHSNVVDFYYAPRVAGSLRLRVERRYGIFQEIVEKHAIFGLV